MNFYFSFSLNEFESASTKQQNERLVSLKRALDSRSEELVDLEARYTQPIVILWSSSLLHFVSLCQSELRLTKILLRKEG